MVWDWVMGHGSCGSRVSWMMGNVGHGSQNVPHCQLWWRDVYTSKVPQLWTQFFASHVNSEAALVGLLGAVPLNPKITLACVPTLLSVPSCFRVTRPDILVSFRCNLDVCLQNKRTLLPLKKMEQIEIAYPLSLKMTDKEFDAVVRYNLCHYYYYYTFF